MAVEPIPESIPTTGADETPKRAVNARTRAIRQFVAHLASYVTVGFALYRYDLGDNGKINYVWMALSGWGAGLLLHGILTLFVRPEAGEVATSLTQDVSGVIGEIVDSAPKDRIEAIKAISEKLGVDVDLAKDLLGQYLENHPGLL